MATKVKSGAAVTPRTQSLEVFGNAVKDQVLALAAQQTDSGLAEPVRVKIEFEVRWRRGKVVERFVPDPYSIDLCYEICADDTKGKSFAMCYAACNSPWPR